MSLVQSPRLQAGDLDAWTEVARLDARLGESRRFERMESRSVADIHQWWRAGAGICGTSWGKDSVIAAHLVALTGLPIPLVWVRVEGFDMPECEQVRDAFLATHPDARYEERVATLRVPARGEPGYPSGNQDVLRDLVPERYISGVRGSESTVRALSVARGGAVTKRTCRPLAHWTALDVWAYLARKDLPIHPAYAMSCGGAISRDRIRVHMLASAIDTNAVWEDRYYGDVIASALETRRVQ